MNDWGSNNFHPDPYMAVVGCPFRNRGDCPFHADKRRCADPSPAQRVVPCEAETGGCCEHAVQLERLLVAWDVLQRENLELRAGGGRPTGAAREEPDDLFQAALREEREALAAKVKAVAATQEDVAKQQAQVAEAQVALAAAQQELEAQRAALVVERRTLAAAHSDATAGPALTSGAQEDGAALERLRLELERERGELEAARLRVAAEEAKLGAVKEALRHSVDVALTEAVAEARRQWEAESLLRSINAEGVRDFRTEVLALSAALDAERGQIQRLRGQLEGHRDQTLADAVAVARQAWEAEEELRFEMRRKELDAAVTEQRRHEEQLARLSASLDWDREQLAKEMERLELERKALMQGHSALSAALLEDAVGRARQEWEAEEQARLAETKAKQKLLQKQLRKLRKQLSARSQGSHDPTQTEDPRPEDPSLDCSLNWSQGSSGPESPMGGGDWEEGDGRPPEHEQEIARLRAQLEGAIQERCELQGSLAAHEELVRHLQEELQRQKSEMKQMKAALDRDRRRTAEEKALHGPDGGNVSPRAQLASQPSPEQEAIQRSYKATVARLMDDLGPDPPSPSAALPNGESEKHPRAASKREWDSPDPTVRVDDRKGKRQVDNQRHGGAPTEATAGPRAEEHVRLRSHGRDPTSDAKEALERSLDELVAERQRLQEYAASLPVDRSRYDVTRPASAPGRRPLGSPALDDAADFFWADPTASPLLPPEHRRDNLYQLHHEVLAIDDGARLVRNCRLRLQQRSDSFMPGASRRRTQLIKEAYWARVREQQRQTARTIHLPYAYNFGRYPQIPSEVAAHEWEKADWWLYADVLLDVDLLMEVRRVFASLDLGRTGRLELGLVSEWAAEEGFGQFSQYHLLKLVRQTDLAAERTLDFWAFLGFALYHLLELPRRSVPLHDWLAFCAQRAAGGSFRRGERVARHTPTKPWHRLNGP